MEATYYALKSIVVPDVFYYCVRRYRSRLCNNAKIKQLKNEYTKVRPICTRCVADGKEPVTWGACSNLSGILHFIIYSVYFCLLIYLSDKLHFIL